MFGEMRDYLVNHQVKTIFVACPNCYKVFKAYGRELQVKTVYEVLAERGLCGNSFSDNLVTIHDPCAVRFRSEIHAAARSIITGMGLSINEMEHSRKNTVCCGDGV
jgi:Fe-S oxidoreductase